MLDLLRRFESPNVTFIEPDGSWPIVWERARGNHVWDADGRRYVDLTAAFGVAAAGHANARVVRAGQRQMQRLLHAMGDVHPHPLKAELARELSRITFERWTHPRSRITHHASRMPERALTAKTIFCNSGFEAVEAALKTAALATGKPGVIAFTGAYHGLGYGALNVTHRDYFHAPFDSQLKRFAHFVPYPFATEEETTLKASLKQIESHIRKLCTQHSIGAILVEPVQGRGGIRVPPLDFLPLLRLLCDELHLLLICDEVFTGFGRTGRWFACEHSAVIPDIICLGKALAGGFPLSACVGNAELMDAAWPRSSGEALHTSTFLGHPVGCAMAIAQIEEIRRLDVVARSAKLGQRLLDLLRSTPWPPQFQSELRGLGLMAGLELRWRNGSPATDAVVDAIQLMLREGFILLPEGEHANVISITPPLTITEDQLWSCIKALQRVLLRLAPRRHSSLASPAVRSRGRRTPTKPKRSA